MGLPQTQYIIINLYFLMYNSLLLYTCILRTADSAATAQLFGLLIKQKYRVEIATTIDCEGNCISISTGVIMTANAEAQSLLDQLMGADRNALLPTGKKFYVCV